MPTARPRHMLTETDEVADALRDAAHRWPEDRERPAKANGAVLTFDERLARAAAERGVAV